ncbi:hypothetical protein QR680_010436 [Steinernema hermaphroditum]|uniref:F-box domain-containing protein n=1 Tax=Steinernema hermaphroditum TaxID=289476 RepID=A0AA39INZ5_9BILA|nr:hypothetical protein QR680_010436 [Steinernema hermaphroditum]
MDSVPYVFCEDVLERLSRFNLFGMTNLSGQWRSAGQRFLEKRRSFYIIISKDREGWWYGIADEKTRDIENGPHSHEEFLSMDRKHVEFYQVSIYSNPRQLDETTAPFAMKRRPRTKSSSGLTTANYLRRSVRSK